MTIKYICPEKNIKTEGKSTPKVTQRSSYHENFHSDFSPWHYWNEISYPITKCKICDKNHSIDEKDAL